MMLSDVCLCRLHRA